MSAKNEIIDLAAALGEALKASPEVQDYAEAAGEAQADPQALQLRARVDEMYNDLTQRQAAGEVLTRGEIELYYDLEREVEGHPALVKQTQALGQVKDLFTETHSLLTNELGFSLLDTIQ